MAEHKDLFTAWKKGGAWVWAKNRDGVVVLIKMEDFWSQFYEDHPEYIKELMDAYDHPS
jgi:hypothetical protein